MITHQDLLDTAKKYSQSTNEVDLRESVKLSYYYAYHSILTLLDQHNIHCLGTGGLHEQLIYRLKSIGTMNARKAGDLLNRIKSNRVSACYYLDKTFTVSQVNFHILECEKCVNHSKNLFTNEDA